MLQDPIVDEVRKKRFELEKACNNSMEKLFDQAIQLQNNLGDRLATIQKPTNRSAPK